MPIDRAAVSVPVKEGTNLIDDLVERNFPAVPGKWENMDVDATSSSEDLKPPLLQGCNSHPKLTPNQMPAAFTALDASPQRNHLHFSPKLPKLINPLGAGRRAA